jgi:hypothetical protein
MSIFKEACSGSNRKLILVMTDDFTSYVIIKALKIL